jgi:hypothetical protein
MLVGAMLSAIKFKIGKGGHYEKISIRFRSNVSWCGIDVCVDAWGSEGGNIR